MQPSRHTHHIIFLYEDLNNLCFQFFITSAPRGRLGSSPLCFTPHFVGVTADVDELSASVTARQHLSAGCSHARAASNTQIIPLPLLKHQKTFGWYSSLTSQECLRSSTLIFTSFQDHDEAKAAGHGPGRGFLESTWTLTNWSCLTVSHKCIWWKFLGTTSHPHALHLSQGWVTLLRLPTHTMPW